MPDRDDMEMRQLLRALRVPSTSEQAISRIQAAARENPRKGWRWLGALRQMRALVYTPPMRYAIMASMVAFFIVVGLLSSPPSVAPHITDQALLIDIDFEEEHWADNFLENGNGGA
jgi:hypothetical protein